MPAPCESWYTDPDAVCYPSDVDDATWKVVAPILAPNRRRSRPRVHPDRVIYNAILYVLRGGANGACSRRPSSPGRPSTAASASGPTVGIWEALTDILRAEMRLELGREVEPSAGILDGQSVKTGPGGVRRPHPVASPPPRAPPPPARARLPPSNRPPGPRPRKPPRLPPPALARTSR